MIQADEKFPNLIIYGGTDLIAQFDKDGSICHWAVSGLIVKHRSIENISGDLSFAGKKKVLTKIYAFSKVMNYGS
jgi:hypothetical protein